MIQLNGLLRYRTISNPTDFEQPLASTLIHFFNHQTHHRGQVHALLTGLTGTAPSLDLIMFQRQTGIGLAYFPASTGPATRLASETFRRRHSRHTPVPDGSQGASLILSVEGIALAFPRNFAVVRELLLPGPRRRH